MAASRRVPIMTRDVTSIEIKKSTWRELNQQKEPGDSFDDVILRLLARPEPGAVPVEPDDDQQDEEHDDARTCPDCGREFDTVPELIEHVQADECRE